VDTNIVLVIVEVFALLCISAVSIYLILVLVRLKDMLGGMEKDLKEVTSRVLPVLDNMEFITARVKSITENIDDQVMIVRDSIGSVREITDSIVAIERKVQERIEGPILDSVAFVAALVKGVRTFLERVRA
jgi:uncharacterized protein YoxC